MGTLLYMEAHGETGARRPRPHRAAAALLLVVVMVIASLAMWIAVPVAWLWIGSQLTDTQQAQGGPYFVVGVGILISMVAIGLLLGRLNKIYLQLIESDEERVHTAWLRSMRSGREEAPRRHLLDVIMIGSAVIAIIAFAAWFVLLAGDPTPH